MNPNCYTCKGKLVISSERDGDKDAVYILHGPKDCVKNLQIRVEAAETSLANTSARLRNLANTIEAEFRFRAIAGQMDPNTWDQRICEPSLQEALAKAEGK